MLKARAAPLLYGYEVFLTPLWSMASILIASNRGVDESKSDENLFGQGFNVNGFREIRIAKAEREPLEDHWFLTLFTNDRSRQELRDFFRSAVSAVSSNTPSALKWVVLVPGYCSPCPEGLSKASQLLSEEDVNVILFSWPSDPSDPEFKPITKYRQTQESALHTSEALQVFLQDLTDFLVEPARLASQEFRISLIAHSLGNLIIENYTRGNGLPGRSLSMFDNVVLHQADVDFDGHEEWVVNIKARNKTFITTNFYDETLRWISDLVNKTRLGQMSRKVYTANDVVHVDFTGAHNVTTQHWLFGGIDNQLVRLFCRYVTRGESGEARLYPDPDYPGRYQAKPFDHFPPFPFNR